MTWGPLPLSERVREILDGAPALLAPIAVTFTKRLEECGIHPRGVYWKSIEGQTLRFEILLGILDSQCADHALSVNDLGCGYGALYSHLADHPCLKDGMYYGYDISEDMVNAACRHIPEARTSISQSMIATHVADYSIVSGTYNMKMDIDTGEWLSYVKANLTQLWSKTRKGLAFNMLSIHDRNKVFGLYYADAAEFYDFCIHELSPNVELLYDYPIKEWTMFVRR